ncbi:hypothetical protein BH11PLA2_BH11PLA2_44800 [soil metagenome]
MMLVQRFATILLTLAIALAVAAGAWWLVTRPKTPSADTKPAPAANVAKPVKEDDLDTIELSPQAEQRLGLTVGMIRQDSVPRQRLYGGEVVIPAGRTILVAAPLGGVVSAPASGLPNVGATVTKGQAILQLSPLLTPDSRANLAASMTDAQGQVNNAEAQRTLAKIALERAERVLKEGAGSQRQVDESKAAFDVAGKTFDAVTARLDVLKKVLGEIDRGTASAIAIDAPQAGILRALSVQPGQTVPLGAALYEIVDLAKVWIRVPLPVTDVGTLNRTMPATIAPLSGTIRDGTSAAPVVAPPSANPLSGTIDAYFELPNPDLKYVPGQRVGATLLLNEQGIGLLVPWSAIVIDIHGSTWVFVKTGEHRYARRRVEVLATRGPDAVLSRGPASGVSVVTAGAMELFGAETGFVK